MRRSDVLDAIVEAVQKERHQAHAVEEGLHQRLADAEARLDVLEVPTPKPASRARKKP